jgi:4-hydroxybenzoate polyprenyltransferase
MNKGSILYKKIHSIIKLSFTPFSIFSPLPIFCFTLFFISSKFTEISLNEIYILSLGIIITLISSGASNFWNHTNDIEEDIRNKKETFLTNGTISQNEAVIISIVLYSISLILILCASYLLARPIYLFFIVWLIITWWYSDNLFLKKITGVRLKTHYIGEIITYGIAFPAYTMSIWLIFSDSLITGLVLSVIFLCFGLAGVLLKDLKDIKGDREAGLRTLGVIFSPSKLIKTACLILIVYFSLIIIATNNDIFSCYSFLVIIPFMYLIKETFIHFQLKNWTLEIGDNKNIKAMILSTYSSLVIMGFANFF